MTKLEQICIDLNLNYRTVYQRLQDNVLKFRRDKIIDDYSILLNYLENKLTISDIAKILGISRHRTQRQLDLIKSHKHTDESFKVELNHKSDCMPYLELKKTALRRFYLTIKHDDWSTSEIAFKDDFCKKFKIDLSKLDYKVTKRL